MMENRSIKWSHGQVLNNDNCLMHRDEVEELVRLSVDKFVIEIGSYRGGSARAMLPECAYLVCIDPHSDIWWSALKTEDEPSDVKGKEVQAEFLKTIEPWKHKCRYIQKYSTDFKRKELLEFTTYDLLFIDGDHSYEGCFHDLEKFHNCLHPNGIIAIHDYSLQFGGVIAACTNHFKRNPDYLINTLAVYKL